MAKRKPSVRAVRRARGREHERLARELERVARLDPGGAPDRPIAIQAPTQVEPITEGRVCPLCAGVLRVEEHAAETHGGVRLRVAHARCQACGVRRAVYFRLATALS